jgi:hypothetical protein
MLLSLYSSFSACSARWLHCGAVTWSGKLSRASHAPNQPPRWARSHGGSPPVCGGPVVRIGSSVPEIRASLPEVPGQVEHPDLRAAAVARARVCKRDRHVGVGLHPDTP